VVGVASTESTICVVNSNEQFESKSVSSHLADFLAFIGSNFSD
jgi:hypothetical protein